MIPTGELRIETQSTNPPKPIGFHVVADGRTVAVLPFEDVKAAVERYQTMADGRPPNPPATGWELECRDDA